MKRFSLMLSLTLLLMLFLPMPSHLTATIQAADDRQTPAACPKGIGGTPAPTVVATTPQTPVLTPEGLVSTYFTANRERRYEDMAALYSDYSLTFFQLSRAELLAGFLREDFEGISLLDFKLIQTEKLSDTQYLLTVMVRRMDADGRESTTTWKLVVIQEQGGWKLNASHRQYGPLIDYKILTVPAQTRGQITIQPRYLARYIGGIMVGFCLHNGTQQVLLWTWVNEVALTFTFSSGITCDVPGNPSPLTFQGGGTYPDYSSIVLNCPNSGYPIRITFKNLRLANSMGLPADLSSGLSFTFNLP